MDTPKPSVGVCIPRPAALGNRPHFHAQIILWIGHSPRSEWRLLPTAQARNFVGIFVGTNISSGLFIFINQHVIALI
jgi:hypothetical protein